MPHRIAVVLKGYPRLSETFIAQELLALERAGLELHLFSLRHPTDKAVHPVHREIRAPVTYLPEYLYQEPLRVLRGWWKARRLPGFGEARRHFLRDLRRDFTPNRGRRFGQACVLAAEMPDLPWLYVHFLHTPGSVTRYAAEMRQLPWSTSAHAKDIWTIPEWEKREKLSAMRWLVTCTAAGARHLRTLADPPDKVTLVYHGLDLARFPAAPARSPRRGDDPADPVVILSVGRAVEKKGYDDLLAALALLPEDLHWRFVHIGGGLLSKDLRRQGEQLGLADRIAWRGAQPQGAVIEAYREADIFVLASKVAADGDRDGLPNVLMEAATQALPTIATDVSAIPEFVESGRTGSLVPPSDPVSLAAAVEALCRDPERRQALGRAAEERVRGRFSLQANVGRLLALFGGEA